MTKDVENRFAPLLSGLGFVAETRPNWILWRFAGPPSPAGLASTQDSSKSRGVGRGLAGLRPPWRLEQFEIAERKGRLSLHKLVVRLDAEVLRASLATATRKYFGSRTRADFVAGKQGGIWCFFEFTRHGARLKGAGDASSAKSAREKPQGNAQTSGGALLPHGLGGFDLRIGADGGAIAAILSDPFGVGYLPQNFASAPLRLIADAFGLKQLGEELLEKLRTPSIHELKIPVTLVGLACVGERLGLKPKDVAATSMLGELFDMLAEGRLTGAREATQIVVDAGGVTVAVPGSDDVASALTAVPLEVLESRERGGAYPDLDEVIRASKFKKAARLVTGALEREPRNLYLLRRLALLGLAGQKEWTNDVAARALAVEANSKLFLAGAVNLALDAGDQAATLRLLSRLGARLATDVEGFEALGAFDMVLPELLGDAWCNEDRRKAEDCYLRIVQKRGDLPRILRKLISLAKASGRPDVEGGYLKRLAGVERRRVELAKIYLRLAELRKGQVSGRDESIQLALRALKLDPALFAAAVLAGEQLHHKGDGPEAIALLDGVLRDSVAMSPKGRSRLEGMIGRIWLRGLARPDLAEPRLSQAVAHDVGNVEALRDLEEVYRAAQNFPGLAGVLEARFDVHEKTGDSDGLHRTFEELAALYRDVMGEPRKAYELYQRLLLSASIDHLELDRVLAWRDVEIDWQDLYAKLRAKLGQITAGEARGRFLCRLAEICREKLGDGEASLGHHVEALDSGWIDAGGFDHIVEGLTRKNDYETLARAYDQRIEQVDGEERRRLVLELLSLPGALSDGRRDELAVQAYALDPVADKAVHQRVRYYQSIDDVEALARLIDGVLSGGRVGELERATWLRLGIEALEACIDDQRFVHLEHLYRALVDIAEDRTDVLRDAVESLRHAPDATLIVPYIARLLESGVLPPIDDRQVLRYLSGLDHELALYHQLMSMKAVDAQEASQHARTAAALYSKRANQETNTEKMLARVAMLVPCSEADIHELKELVQRTGNWILLARVLQKQAEFEDERRRKFTLLEWLGRIHWQKLKDYAKARQALGQALKIAPEPWRMRLALANLAAEAKDTVQERKALYDFIQDPKAGEQLAFLGKAVQRLLSLGDEPEALQGAIMPMIESATARGKHDLAGSLSTILLEHQIATAEIYRSAFKAAVGRRDTDRAVDVWWRGLASVGNRSKAKAFLAETRLILEREDRDDLLIACFEAALARDVGTKLGPKVKQEILFQYGALLFDDDERRHRALAVYRDAHAVDPDNSRAWMPLYFLLLEFGTPEARYAHLEFIVPRLELDQRPLKAFPITVESLQAEYRDLAEQLGAVPAERRAIGGEPAGFAGSMSAVGGAGAFAPRPEPVSEGSFEETAIAEGSATSATARAMGGGESEGVAVDLGIYAPAAADLGPMALSLDDMGDMGEQAVPVVDLGDFVPEPPSNGKDADFSSGMKFDLGDEGEVAASTSIDLEDVGTNLDLDVEPVPTPVVADELAAVTGLDLSMDLDVSSGVTVDEEQAPPLEGSFSLEDAEPAAVERAAIKPDMGSISQAISPERSGLLEFGAAGSAIGPAAMAGEVSSVELAAAIGMSDADMDATVRADSAHGVGTPSANQIGDQSGLPLPAGSSSGMSAGGSSGGSSDHSLRGSARFGSGASSVSKVSDSSYQGGEGEGDATDWRAAVLKGDFNADLTSRLLKQAFASEIEKHLAIQCVAVVAGNCDRLSNWHWRVWRHPEEYGYLRSGKDRYPAEAAPAALSSSLYKFVIAATPLMVKVFRDRFVSGYIARKLQMPPGSIEKLRKQMPWHEGLLGAVGFKTYAERFAERRFVVFNLPGLGRDLFYEGGSRSLYVDEAYYRTQPPSHLFHRILGTLWSVRNHTFVPLALHPQKHVVPLFREIDQYFGAQGLSKIRSRLTSGSVVAKYLGSMDTQQIRPLHEKVGMPAEEQIVQLWEAMRLHVFRLLLAETLDVVGLVEMLTSRDLLKPDAVKHSEVYQLSPYVRLLLDFATKLKF